MNSVLIISAVALLSSRVQAGGIPITHGSGTHNGTGTAPIGLIVGLVVGLVVFIGEL